jgi:hypothetical protein
MAVRTLSLPAASAPARLRTLLAVTVLACLAWGAVTAWTVFEHASAAGNVVATSEPLSLEAQQLYRSLSDADVTATTAFLAGPQQPLAARQRYAADIATAAADLAGLKAAAGSGGARQQADLAAISAGLPQYTGYVAQAQTEYSLGYQLTGGSFMQVASEEMHLTLLPAARSGYALENTRLAAASAGATGLPWIIVVLVAAAAIGYLLLRTQRWLTRRTHRVVNVGLAGATLILAVCSVWLLVSFFVARSDLHRGVSHGSAPAETLAQAGIAAAQARGDEILNLISRSGGAIFDQDFVTVQRELGPGRGTLLTSAAAASAGEPGARWAGTAGRDAQAWYTVNDQVFKLDLAAHYAAETHLVIGAGPASSSRRFSTLEADLGRAITADQVIFARSAAAGRDAYGGLAAGIIAGALLMAAGCAWGLDRRLAEYR